MGEPRRPPRRLVAAPKQGGGPSFVLTHIELVPNKRKCCLPARFFWHSQPSPGCPRLLNRRRAALHNHCQDDPFTQCGGAGNFQQDQEGDHCEGAITDLIRAGDEVGWAAHMLRARHPVASSSPGSPTSLWFFLLWQSEQTRNSFGKRQEFCYNERQGPCFVHGHLAHLTGAGAKVIPLFMTGSEKYGKSKHLSFDTLLHVAGRCFCLPAHGL